MPFLVYFPCIIIPLSIGSHTDPTTLKNVLLLGELVFDLDLLFRLISCSFLHFGYQLLTTPPLA